MIASLSGSLDSDWDGYATMLAQTGVDAMELNLGLVPADPTQGADTVEATLVEVVGRVQARIQVPLAVKLPPWFTTLANFAAQLESTGVSGLVLFSRFQEIWIDADELELHLEYTQSSRADLPLRMRWLAILSAQRSLDLAISGGVETGKDAIVALMAGASSVQIVSQVLSGGPSRIQAMLDEVESWLGESEYTAVAELEGCMNIERCPDPAYYLQHEPVGDLMRNWAHRR